MPDPPAVTEKQKRVDRERRRRLLLRLTVYRLDAEGLTQAEIALRVGVSQVRVSQFLKELRN
jgi:DNA-directed RNA polymerase specialized sigma subunit